MIPWLLLMLFSVPLVGLPARHIQMEVKGTTSKPPVITFEGDFPTPAWTFDGWSVNKEKGKWRVALLGKNVQKPGTFVTQVLVPFTIKRPLVLPAGTHKVRIEGQRTVLEKTVTIRDDGIITGIPYLRAVKGPQKWPAGKPLVLTVEGAMPDTAWRFQRLDTQRLDMTTVVITPWATRKKDVAGADVLVPFKKSVTLDKLPSGTVRVVVEGEGKVLHHTTEIVVP